MHSLFAEIDIN